MYFECLKRLTAMMMSRALMIFAVLFMAGFSLLSFPKNATALCGDCDPAIDNAKSYIWEEAQDDFDKAIDESFQDLQKFIIHQMWEQSILPAMMLSAEQLTAVAMQQVMTIGMFIDAESQMEAQLLLQEIRAKAHKDYHPSVGMCEFGSVMKSLAATERRGEVTAVILSRRSLDRQLGQRDGSGMYGSDLDKAPRINQFKSLFCNIKDRGDVLFNTYSALLSLCSSNMLWDNAAFDEDARERMNKDIDYFALVDSPWSLNIDFTNEETLGTGQDVSALDNDEEHILAMASNLYAHDTFPRIPPRLIANKPGHELNTMQKAYMDMRAIIAKRSVAENSFYAIAAMKAEGNKAAAPSGGGGCTLGTATGGNNCASVSSDGTPTSDPVSGSIDGPQNSRIYMEHILKELGVPSDEALTLLGENPSYYAQMEMLTKKLYQNPDFYTNLYDKPANVERKAVALQAIKLMQKFDILKSFLRGEASTSILLELAVSDLQGEIEDQIQIVGVGGN